MQSRKWILSLLILFTLSCYSAWAQKNVKKPQPTKANTEARNLNDEQKKVRDIIDFLQFMLNTLGSNNTSSRDKDVLITQSYSKIFRDGKVQVEDDLDEARDVITNKDVIAYLKDVDFFFKDVKFEIDIENIAQSTLPNGELFYKVTTRRTLKGTTSDGDAVSNTIPRFIEVNYNPKDQDLKIVSIYTHEFNEKEALTAWWKELSYEWQGIFKRALKLTDSASYADIKKATGITKLDLGNNQYIQDIAPLAQLPNLTYLNIAGTSINDLTPIRNLTELIFLDLSATSVSDLSPLRYSNKLEHLNISATKISDISVLEKMSNLKTLKARSTGISIIDALKNLTECQEIDLSKTSINSLESLAGLSKLNSLDISTTQVNNLSSLKGVSSLQILKMDSSKIISLEPLSTLGDLKMIYANATAIHDLTPLENLTQLERIYCDQTQITQEKARAFMNENPTVLVIFDSKDLKLWWETLTPEWQTVFCNASGISTEHVKSGEAPSKEELAKITNLDSVNLNRIQLIVNLEPLKNLHKLKKLIAAGTPISDLSPLQDHREITYLDISETNIQDINLLQQFKKLKVLKAENGKIQNIEFLLIPSIEKFYADKTSVHDIIAREFLEKNPSCLLLYKSSRLNTWWTSLNSSWKNELQQQLGVSPTISDESLHRLVESKFLSIKSSSINELTPLQEFVQLKELRITGTSITTFPNFENLQSLKILQTANSPLYQIESIGKLFNLEELDISNTPIDDLYPIWRLDNLKKLNCSGTQIKRLNAVEKLTKLEHLDCSNTNVRQLDPLSYLKLKSLACYNTRVPTREIENFKGAHPDCDVVYYR